MSQENVDLVRRRLEAVNRGDMAAMIGLTDPDAVWWDRADDPWASAPHLGRDVCMEHLAEILDATALQVEAHEWIDAGNQVIVDVRLVGHWRASGATFDEHEFHVSTLRGGLVTETREYRNRTDALKAVGLEG